MKVCIAWCLLLIYLYPVSIVVYRASIRRIPHAMWGQRMTEDEQHWIWRIPKPPVLCCVQPWCVKTRSGLSSTTTGLFSVPSASSKPASGAGTTERADGRSTSSSASNSTSSIATAMLVLGLGSGLYLGNLWTTTFEVVDPAARSTSVESPSTTSSAWRSSGALRAYSTAPKPSRASSRCSRAVGSAPAPCAPADRS